MLPHCQRKSKMCTLKKQLDNIDNGINQLQSTGEYDRLSSLPDNLFISILSLLPTSSAVATSISSHRWRHLWTNITDISFGIPCYSEDISHKFQKSITTINHVISKFTSPKLHSFHLLYASFKAQEQACSFLLFPIVLETCFQNPEVIEIIFDKYSESLFKLPPSLFKTQSLVELILVSPFEFDFGADAQIVNLPNLKILEMSLRDSHRRLMHTLLKSCPLLERLCLRLALEEENHYVDIVAPNLKFLTVHDNFKKYLLLIDAPKLVNLETSGCPGSVFYHFVKTLRYLREAIINIPEYHVGDGIHYTSRILSLLEAISCARSLTFNRCFNNHLLDVSLPSFPNLVDLKFDCFYQDSSSWIPSCLLSNVKSLAILEMNPNDCGIRLLQDILSNATVLEQLQVSTYEFTGDGPLETRVWEEYEFAMKLFMLPKSSPSCQIEFSGEIITISCEDFRNGRITCELQNRIYDFDSE